MVLADELVSLVVCLFRVLVIYKDLMKTLDEFLVSMMNAVSYITSNLVS